MIKIHRDLLQGTDEWLEARRGLLTASEMKRLLTPAKLELANNDDVRSHVYNIAAQRVLKHIEPSYESYDMMRGNIEEAAAAQFYNKHFQELESVGFITNDKWGFTLGYSPDGLTTSGLGQIEVKSRNQQLQFKTIVDGEVPKEFMIQLQTGLLVSERVWVDFISYSGGMPMWVKHVEPIKEYQVAILDAAEKFEEKVYQMMQKYKDRLADPNERFVLETPRTQMEIVV